MDSWGWSTWLVGTVIVVAAAAAGWVMGARRQRRLGEFASRVPAFAFQTISNSSLVVDCGPLAVVANEPARRGGCGDDQFVDAMPIIIWRATSDGTIQAFNKHWYQSTGQGDRKPAGGCGISTADLEWQQFIHLDDREPFVQWWKASVASGETSQFAHRLLLSEANYRWHLSRSMPVRNEEGKITCWLGTCTDVDDLKRAAVALYDSEQHFRDVLDSLPVFVFVLCRGGRIRGINHVVSTTLEVADTTYDQIAGQHFCDTRGPFEVATKRGELESAIEQAASGQVVQVNEVTFGRGRRTLVVDMTFAPMLRAGGEASFLIVSAIDVTQRVSAEQRGQEHQAALTHLERVRVLGQMASGLAHELNQPLGALMNYAEVCRTILVETDTTASRQLDVILNKMSAQALRAGEIIRRMRNFVKRQASQHVLCSINTLIKETTAMLAYEFRAASLLPTLELAEDLPQVSIDPVQLSQVLVNLARNAIDAIGSLPLAERSLIIRTSLAAGQSVPGQAMVCIGVIDNGRGIPASDLSKVFEAFYTTKREGLGIGLSICKAIVEDQDGLLTVQSNPGKQTIFTIALPVAKTFKSEGELGGKLGTIELAAGDGIHR